MFLFQTSHFAPLMRYPHDHENEVAYFARTNFRNELRKFGIKTDDRRRHTYIIGKTGMGKTVLMENLFLSDVYAGHGCCYVDPHGDTAERLVDYIPSWRINDVVYFNPADTDFPMGFNILESIDERYKHLVASGMMGVFKKIWENVWSARMEYILNNTILALLENPGSTLLGINRMLSDAEYRKRIVSNVKDPLIKQFWLTEYVTWNEKYAQEAVAPIQNKVGQFLSSSIIRNIVAQVKSTINVREIMDSEKIFIVNLAKGRVGEDNSRLLGGMLITKIQLAAMERVDTPEKDRADFYLYVDEFQNFAVESFASILSEARKYRLCLIVAHQYIDQLSDEVREAVFGNVGTIITFRVGATDATFMETEFAPRFMPEDIINLPKYNVYLKLLIDGVTSQPFSALTLPPIATRTGSEQKVINVSHERYALSRTEIEDKVLKWSGMEGADVDTLLEAAKEKKKAIKESTKPQFKYACSRCGKEVIVHVELDASRPIFCAECIEIVREERKNKGGASKDRPKTATTIGATAPKREERPPEHVRSPVKSFVSEVSVSLAALAAPVPSAAATKSVDSASSTRLATPSPSVPTAPPVSAPVSAEKTDFLSRALSSPSPVSSASPRSSTSPVSTPASTPRVLPTPEAIRTTSSPSTPPRLPQEGERASGQAGFSDGKRKRSRKHKSRSGAGGSSVSSSQPRDARVATPAPTPTLVQERPSVSVAPTVTITPPKEPSPASTSGTLQAGGRVTFE